MSSGVLLILLLLSFSIFFLEAETKPSKKAKVDDGYDIICPVEDIKKFDDVVTKIVSFGKEQRQFPSDRTKLQPYCR